MYTFQGVGIEEFYYIDIPFICKMSIYIMELCTTILNKPPENFLQAYLLHYSSSSEQPKPADS